MADSIEIANSALTKIGATHIVSFGDGTKNANAVEAIYDPLRRDLLRAHYWNFAMRWRKLARLTAVPEAGFDYFFALPADWIRTARLSDDDAGLGDVDYREESNGTTLCIACSADDVWLRYVYDVSDPNIMSADFRETLAAMLARDLAIPIVQSNSLREEMKDEMKSLLRRARSTDALSEPPQPRRMGTWVTQRFGGIRRC